MREAPVQEQSTDNIRMWCLVGRDADYLSGDEHCLEAGYLSLDLFGYISYHVVPMQWAALKTVV